MVYNAEIMMNQQDLVAGWMKMVTQKKKMVLFYLSLSWNYIFSSSFLLGSGLETCTDLESEIKQQPLCSECHHG